MFACIDTESNTSFETFGYNGYNAPTCSYSGPLHVGPVSVFEAFSDRVLAESYQAGPLPSHALPLRDGSVVSPQAQLQCLGQGQLVSRRLGLTLRIRGTRLHKNMHSQVDRMRLLGSAAHSELPATCTRTRPDSKRPYLDWRLFSLVRHLCHSLKMT